MFNRITYIVVIFIFSTTPLAIKVSGHGAGFSLALALRMSIAVILMLAYMLIVNRRLAWGVREWKIYLATGLGIGPAMICVYWGAQYINSGMVSVIYGLNPFIVGLLSIVILRINYFSRVKIVGLFIAIIGLYLMLVQTAILSPRALMGAMAVLVSTVFFGFSSVWLKHIGDSPIPVFDQVLGGLLLSLPMFWGFWFYYGAESPSSWSLVTVVSIGYLGVGGSLVGFMAYYRLLQEISLQQVALIPVITPAIALIIGRLLADEVMSLQAYAGVALVILGLVVYQLLKMPAR